MPLSSWKERFCPFLSQCLARKGGGSAVQCCFFLQDEPEIELEEEDEGDADSEGEAEVPENHCILRMMQNNIGSAQSASVVNQLCTDLNKTERTILRYMRCIALKCRNAQLATLDELAQYLTALHASGSIECVSMTWQQIYDETQHNLRVQFAEDAGMESQTAKVFVVETAWSMLVRNKSGMDYNAGSPEAATNFLHIQGVLSPFFSAADSATAQSTAAVLAASPPVPACLTKIFRFSTRVAESDEAPANIKAERMFQQHLLDHGHEYEHLHWVCSAHKAHAMAEKCWDMSASTLTGVCAALLDVQKTQPLARLRAALLDIIAERVRILPAQPLTEAARDYRSHVVKLYCPRVQYPRKRATLLGFCAIYNGDWRSHEEVIHICDGCCESPQETVEKMQHVANQLLRTLRPHKLCRANWLEWCKPLQYMIFGHIHDLLRAAYEAFSNQARDVPVDEASCSKDL